MRTKIICTMGPSTNEETTIAALADAGMNVARVNFSHGTHEEAQHFIKLIRSESERTGNPIAILGDLAGPKIRIGELQKESFILRPGEELTITTKDVVGTAVLVSTTYPNLVSDVNRGDRILIDDGRIELAVEEVRPEEVKTRIVVGGVLKPHKGMNLPGVSVSAPAITAKDFRDIEFAICEDIDLLALSFVRTPRDVEKAKKLIANYGADIPVIAKIEKEEAVNDFANVLAAADGIMIARGDLGVEMPLERVPAVQKMIIAKCNTAGKPVITATQMLESMTANRRPTRAEATDVANAILDGTDCVMLSGESAMGKYPVEATAMLSRIAATIEPHRPGYYARETLKGIGGEGKIGLTDLIALSVETTLERISPAAVFVPTHSGATARSIARFRFPVWITAVSSSEATCQRLQFSYGVYPMQESDHPDDWKGYARKWLQDYEVSGNLVVVTEGPSAKHPEANHRMEIIDLERKI